MISVLWRGKRPHTSKECRCRWGRKFKLVHQVRVKNWCTKGKKGDTLILSCTDAKWLFSSAEELVSSLFTSKHLLVKYKQFINGEET